MKVMKLVRVLLPIDSGDLLRIIGHSLSHVSCLMNQLFRTHLKQTFDKSFIFSLGMMSKEGTFFSKASGDVFLFCVWLHRKCASIGGSVAGALSLHSEAPVASAPCSSVSITKKKHISKNSSSVYLRKQLVICLTSLPVYHFLDSLFHSIHCRWSIYHPHDSNKCTNGGKQIQSLGCFILSPNQDHVSQFAAL